MKNFKTKIKKSKSIYSKKKKKISEKRKIGFELKELEKQNRRKLKK